MMKIVRNGLWVLLTLVMCCAQASAKDYHAEDFGAVADGFTLNTRTLQHAIDHVHEQGGGRLIFSLGRFVTGTLHMRSNVTLHLEDGAILLGSTNPFDYERDVYTAMILARDVENIGITGQGTINCRGREVAYNLVNHIHNGIVKDGLKLDRPLEGSRPMIFYWSTCRNVTVQGITLLNSASWVQTYDQCVGLNIDGIRVESNAYWNNDGLDIVDCHDVVVSNSFFDAADDAICLKSHDPKALCKNILIYNNVARSGASGIKFGTASQGGFIDIRIIKNKVYDTFRSAITIATVDGGIVENILIDSLTAVNTGNIIFLRTGLRGTNNAPARMNNIVIQNVVAQVPATKPDRGYDYEGPVEDNPRNISPCSIVGQPDIPITNVTLRNITITYPGAGSPLYAYRGLSDAELDAIPEMRKSYPEFSQFQELPAWGMYIRHAREITFENVVMEAIAPDYRPALVTDDVDGLHLDNIHFFQRGGSNSIALHLKNTTNVTDGTRTQNQELD